MNTLQAELVHSKAWERFLREYCEQYDIPEENLSIRESWQQIAETFSDKQIRGMCRVMLEGDDLTEEERNELLHILCID